MNAAGLQIQCYQCEDVRQDDCSSPEFIVNCTVNVQDMCQKEVLVMEDGKIITLIYLTVTHNHYIAYTSLSIRLRGSTDDGYYGMCGDLSV